MDYLNAINLDDDIDIIYKFMNDSSLNKKHQAEIELNKLRNDNHKRYYKINIMQLKNLPSDFQNVVNQIVEIYKKIIRKDILNEEEEKALETKNLLDAIDLKIKRIESMLKTTIKELEEENKKNKQILSIVDLKNLDIDEKKKRRALNLYNDLVLFSANVENNVYDDLKYQLTRKKYIDEIIKIINLAKVDKINKDKINKTKELNIELNKVISDTNDKVQYLSDLISDGSEYEDSFNDFLNFYNKILDYDETNYSNVKQTLEILSDKSKFANYIDEFKSKLSNNNLIANKLDENEKKVIALDIKRYIDYINFNYSDLLDKPRKLVMDSVANMIKNNNVDTDVIINNLCNIVNFIWQQTITSTKNTDNFYILCSNSQFKEPKTEAILLSKLIVDNMDNYMDYQIGFILNYNKNIINTTKNDDIMAAKNNYLSKLKTPKQIEMEYVNYKALNRIILDGYKTDIVGVYFIDDGDKIKYSKALELSNSYKLPLIILKKNYIKL